MTFTKNIFYNTLAQYFGKAISLATSIFVTAILTRHLGITGYGRYVYLLTLVMFANSFADWGSTFIATRESAQHPAKQPTIYFTSLVTRLSINLVFTFLLLVFGFYFPALKQNYSALVLAALLLPLTSLKMSLQIVFQSRFQLWRLSLIDTLSSLIFLALLLVFRSRLNIDSVFLYLTLAAAASAVFGFLLATSLTRFNFRFDYGFARHLVSQSLSMGLLLTLFSLYNRLDIFILERYQGPSAVGIYGLSYKVYENLILAAGFLANATFPLLSSRISNPKLFRQAFEKYLAALFILGISGFILAFLFAPLVINLLAGNDFAAATQPLRLLSISLMAAFLGHATGYSLVALNRQTFAAKVALIALIFNAGFNLIFVPRYSYLASATITIFTEWLVFIVEFVFLYRFMGGFSLVSGLRALSPRRLYKSLT